MAERSSAIFWVLCPKQSLHCYSMRSAFSKINQTAINLQRLNSDRP
ncbi:MAG: hypothetical protein IM556_07990 [Pseudanabaena sp. M110S1SP2A07QC]|nr:hypothetical protein [Pseudanabaena sp. M110S1SP2A07QC]